MSPFTPNELEDEKNIASAQITRTWHLESLTECYKPVTLTFKLTCSVFKDGDT